MRGNGNNYRNTRIREYARFSPNDFLFRGSTFQFPRMDSRLGFSRVFEFAYHSRIICARSASKCGFRRCDLVKPPYAVPAILQCNFPSRITEANNSPLAGTLPVFCLGLMSEATSISFAIRRRISYREIVSATHTRTHAFYRDAILVDQHKGCLGRRARSVNICRVDAARRIAPSEYSGKGNNEAK